MSRRSPLLAWGLPIAGLAALTAGSMMVMANAPQRPPEVPPRQPPTAPIDAASAAPSSGRKPVFIGAIGITEPPGEAVQIASHTAGVVEAVLVAPGATVAAGAPLFVVDQRTAKEEIALRTAELALRRAEVDALRGVIPTRIAEVASAEAALLAADASILAASVQRDDAANLLRIAESVDDPRAIAAEEVDRRRFALQAAEAALTEAAAGRAQAIATRERARAALALLVDPNQTGEGGGDGPDLVAVERGVERAAADLARAQVALDLLTVRAPVDGTILQVNIRPGEFAPAKELTEGLIVIARSGAMRVRAQIDEVDIPRFRADAKAWASPRGAPDQRLPLVIDLVEPMVVPKRALSGRTSELIDTRVLEVVYTLDGDARGIAVGQQMDIYIEAPDAGGAP
jgi:HlyD family secretion protein